MNRDFRRVWAAATISGLGDGVRMFALPWLTLLWTGDATAVAIVVAAEQLPWLLFSLHAGALADRWNRHRVLVATNLARAGVIGAFALAVALGAQSVVLLASLGFLLSCVQTLAMSAASAILPAVVEPGDLRRANSRLAGTQILAVQLIGPSIGAALTSMSYALPLAADAASFLVAGLLMVGLRDSTTTRPATRPQRMHGEAVEGLLRLSGRYAPTGFRLLGRHRPTRRLGVQVGLVNLATCRSRKRDLPPGGGRHRALRRLGLDVGLVNVGTGDVVAVLALFPTRGAGRHHAARGLSVQVDVVNRLRREMLDGLRWLWRDRELRGLCVQAGIANVALGGITAVCLLFATEVLGVGALGTASFASAAAIGGALAAALAPRFADWVGGAVALRISRLGAALAVTVGSLTSSVAVALGTMVLFGAAHMVFNVVANAYRQAAVPAEMQGRVASGYWLIAMCAVPIGTLAGGVLATAAGVRAPIIAAGLLLFAGYWWMPRLEPALEPVAIRAGEPELVLRRAS